MQEILTYLADEWAVIERAPFAFVMALILVAGIVYLVTKGFAHGKVSALSKIIALRDHEIAQFKEKLGTTSPDEISARIDALTDKVLSFRRSLSDADKTKLSAVLAETTGMVEIKQDSRCADAQQYAHDIGIAFESAGWRVIHADLWGQPTRRRAGWA